MRITSLTFFRKVQATLACLHVTFVAGGSPTPSCLRGMEGNIENPKT